MGLINFGDGFIYLKFEDTKALGLKLFQVWTNLTTVLLVEGKVRKLGLKLRIEKILFKINFFKKNRKARFVLKKWAYFSSKWAGLK